VAETALAAVVVLLGAAGLAVMAIRFGMLLGGFLARRIDEAPDEQPEEAPRDAPR
jgi:hypothetical protein